MGKNELKTSIDKIRNTLALASNAFNYVLYGYSDDPEDEDYSLRECSDHIERAFIQLLMLLETRGLSRTYEEAKELYAQAKKVGFGDSDKRPGCDDPHLIWKETIEHYLDAISISYGIESQLSVSSDLEHILRSSLYSITDANVFGGPPNSEKEVHLRIESILRCIYPDVKTKPTLTKPIKNFEPDTGLVSARTLIEYKFLSSASDTKRIAEEILIDSRGYTSRDWDTFVYVIYETKRIKSENEWNLLAEKCGFGQNSKIIVLSGERPQKSACKRARNRKGKED